MFPAYSLLMADDTILGTAAVSVRAQANEG